mmetsp:Transcript_24621/g.52477  ORF Transcript_24621/g.52477 Transcript_24621/m.52477 type:complete len:216 (-) Transcript_24621:47-694(-)
MGRRAGRRGRRRRGNVPGIRARDKTLRTQRQRPRRARIPRRARCGAPRPAAVLQTKTQREHYHQPRDRRREKGLGGTLVRRTGRQHPRPQPQARQGPRCRKGHPGGSRWGRRTGDLLGVVLVPVQSGYPEAAKGRFQGPEDPKQGLPEHKSHGQEGEPIDERGQCCTRRALDSSTGGRKTAGHASPCVATTLSLIMRGITMTILGNCDKLPTFCL